MADKDLAQSVRDRCRVLSVFGPFNAQTLVMMPTELAHEVWPDGIASAARPDVVEAVERELEEIRRRRGAEYDSALAATALAMAFELQDPFNSATSKSMCAKALSEAMRELHALAPPQKETDGVDDLATRRAERRAAATAVARP